MNFIPNLGPTLRLSQPADSGGAPFEPRAIALKAHDSIILGDDSVIKPSVSNGCFAAVPVSPKHAEVWFQNRQLYIRDLKSDLGTFLNGTKIERPSMLHNGDIITLGIEIPRSIDTPSSLTDDELKPIVAKISASGI